MALQSKLFRGDPKLEAAAKSNPAHILPGASGPHVGKIQTALIQLDGAVISSHELQNPVYGPSTANAVLAYKQKRNIINRSYQQAKITRLSRAARGSQARPPTTFRGQTAHGNLPFIDSIHGG